MVVLIRCNDLVSDSRAQKYIDFYIRNKIDYKLIAWDRLATEIQRDNTSYYKGKSKYNQGGWKAVIDRIKWMWFVFCSLKSLGKNHIVVHACDLDAVYPACLYKVLFNKKAFVIFDVFDWYSDNLRNQGKLILMAFRIMESFSIKNSNHCIICEQERLSQIPYDISSKYSVLPNIPSFNNDSFLRYDSKFQFNNELITLSYVGGFVKDRCLDLLIEGARQGYFNLLIAGFGDEGIIKNILKTESDNIKYFGKVGYEEGQNIMYNSDIVYAMYSKVSPNNIYAAPNKYYEAMFLGKPIVTTKGILLSKKVENNMGYVIEENLSALISVVKKINENEIIHKSFCAKEQWSKYRNVVQDYLNNFYYHLVGCDYWGK